MVGVIWWHRIYHFVNIRYSGIWNKFKNLIFVLSLHWFWVIICGILSSDSFCKGNNSIKFSLSKCHNTIIMVNQFKKGVRPCEQIFFFKSFFFKNLHRQFSPNVKRIGSVIQINHITVLFFLYEWTIHPVQFCDLKLKKLHHNDEKVHNFIN